MGTSPAEAPSARERILETAYELFSRRGTHAVGVDAIVAGSGVAKMSLYRNFGSKDELIIAFLRRREQVWGHDWLVAEVAARSSDPAERLLAIFDVCGEWFAREDFEGCAFVSVLVGIDDRDHPVRQATIRHLAEMREWMADLACAAGVRDDERLARQWHLLLKGATIAALEGDLDAAAQAKAMGQLLLDTVLPAPARQGSS
jgi:AcrR family transcriptional regulator